MRFRVAHLLTAMGAFARRLFRVSLLALLVLLTIACIWLGKISVEARRQKEAVEWVKSSGGDLLYDWELEYPLVFGNVDIRAMRPGPRWLRNWIGDDYFQSVHTVQIFNEGVEDISPLAALDDLEHLTLSRNEISDVSALAELKNLKTINVDFNRISDLKPLAQLSELQKLRLDRNNITDISPLSSLTRLTELQLSENDIRDVSHLRRSTALQVLWLSNNEIFNCVLLGSLRNLKELGLGGNHPITNAEIDTLKEALPRTRISY